MKRRKFLWIGAGVLGAGVLSYSALFASKDFNTVVREMLEEDTKGLKVDKATFDKYIEDAQKDEYWGFTKSKILFVKAYHHLPAITPYQFKYKRFRSIIVGTYLLSTDFFLNKMDVQQPINYIAFYNPYRRACYNPFSSLYYPS